MKRFQYNKEEVLELVLKRSVNGLVDIMFFYIDDCADYVRNKEGKYPYKKPNPDWDYHTCVVECFESWYLSSTFDQYNSEAIERLEQELSDNPSISPERRENFLRDVTNLMADVREFGRRYVKGETSQQELDELRNKEAALNIIAKSLSRKNELFYEKMVVELFMQLLAGKQTSKTDFQTISEQLVHTAHTIESFAKGDMYSSDYTSFRMVRKPVADLSKDLSIMLAETTNSVQPSAQNFTWVLTRLVKSVKAIENSIPADANILLLDSQEIKQTLHKAVEKVRQDFEKVRAEYCEVLMELARPDKIEVKSESKKKGRASKYTPEKIKNMLTSYEKHLQEKNDVKYAWNCVAEEHGIPSAKAAEMAVRRFQNKNK